MGRRREDRGDRRDDTDRDRGYREDRGDEADRWVRAPRQEQPPAPPPRSSSYRPAPTPDRPSHNRRRPDARDDRGGLSAGGGAPVFPASTTRPIIKLQPRTLPVETVGQPVAAAQTAQSIFGGAKPRDEIAYEEERKMKMEATSTFLKAVEDGNLETVKEVAGQINITVKDKDMALVLAADKGYSTMVEWLLTLGADSSIGQVRNISP